MALIIANMAFSAFLWDPGYVIFIMTREERERLILQLLAESGLALPPKAIYVNLKDQGATFSERTVHRLLSSLSERGLVENPPDKSDYYRITEDGLRYLEGELDTDELDPE